MSSLIKVSQKGQYALRAFFELSLRFPAIQVTTVTEIAQSQKIPQKFLEQILLKLRTAGYIESKRGNQGGYILIKDPASVTVAEIIRCIEGADETLDCLKETNKGHCLVGQGCAFKNLWDRAKEALSSVVDQTTFADMVEFQKQRTRLSDYSI